MQIEPGLLGHEGDTRKKQNDPQTEVSAQRGRPQGSVRDRGDCLRARSTDEVGEPQGSRKGRPRYPAEGRGEQMDEAAW
jgi:hypothetical protein